MRFVQVKTVLSIFLGRGLGLLKIVQMGIEADTTLVHQPVDVLYKGLPEMLHGNGLDVFLWP
jgi:hypothetical protein